MVNDSPCTGDCRMEQMKDEVRCRSCYRTYTDLEQWFYMSSDARLERMKQLREDKLKTQ